MLHIHMSAVVLLNPSIFNKPLSLPLFVNDISNLTFYKGDQIPCTSDVEWSQQPLAIYNDQRENGESQSVFTLSDLPQNRRGVFFFNIKACVASTHVGYDFFKIHFALLLF